MDENPAMHRLEHGQPCPPANFEIAGRVDRNRALLEQLLEDMPGGDTGRNV